jgi:hypothetical protein
MRRGNRQGRGHGCQGSRESSSCGGKHAIETGDKAEEPNRTGIERRLSFPLE